MTENVSFIAELQNNQLEETASNSRELGEIKEQMKSIAKAVNLHTRAITKLNRTLLELQKSPIPENDVSGVIDAPDLSRIEEMVVLKAGREEITAISGEMESFKANVENMFSSLQQQLQENMLNYQKLKGVEDELSGVKEELQNMNIAEEREPKTPNVVEKAKEELHSMSVAEESKPRRFSDIPIEDVITGQLSILGSATLKQLEKQINENGVSIDFEKLSLVISYLEQEQLVSSTKKGRYTFYSVTDPASV